MVRAMNRHVLRLPVLLLAAHAGAALAQYKCTAADGAITFQQTPCVGARSEQKLNVIPNGHPAPASGVVAPAPSGGVDINKRMLAGYERQHQRDALAQALQSAQDRKARRGAEKLADIAAARKRFGDDPANARSLSEALASIDSRYVALGEFDDRSIRDAQAALDNGGKPADR